jgi:hypothetical protein
VFELVIDVAVEHMEPMVRWSVFLPPKPTRGVRCPCPMNPWNRKPWPCCH